jgi:type I restriction enzyme S subunit
MPEAVQAKYRPYPAYKPSGEEWLGDIPEEWEVSPVLGCAEIVNGYPFDSKLFNATTGTPLIRIRDLNAIEADTRYSGAIVPTAVVTNDDVLIGMDGDFNVGRWRGNEPALLNQRMCCVRGSSSELTRYLEYALPVPLKLINDVTYSTTVKHLSSYQVEKIRVCLPKARKEISAILTFLDHETTKIDALIAKQQRLIALLEEKRQAVISHAVTKGLDKAALLRPSGIDWLGDVPAHWEVKRVKQVAKLESGHTPDKKIPAYWENCDISWVSLNDTSQLKIVDYISQTAQSLNPKGIANSSARLLPERSVVFTRDASIGLAAITTKPMAVSQHVIAWLCDLQQMNPEYLLFVFYAMKDELERYTFGATLKTIGMPDVNKLTCTA